MIINNQESNIQVIIPLFKEAIKEKDSMKDNNNINN